MRGRAACIKCGTKMGCQRQRGACWQPRSRPQLQGSRCRTSGGRSRHRMERPTSLDKRLRHDISDLDESIVLSLLIHGCLEVVSVRKVRIDPGPWVAGWHRIKLIMCHIWMSR
jgi:hypothetical protein